MPDIPDRYRFAVIPHVFVDGAAEAIEFYERAFGAQEIFRVAWPDGRIVHAELRVGTSVVMLGDPDDQGLFVDPRKAGGRSVGLHVYVDDVDALFARAVKAGARAVQEPQDMFYGDRAAMLTDRFEHLWVFLTHQEDLPPDEIKRRGETLLRQVANA